METPEQIVKYILRTGQAGLDFEKVGQEMIDLIKNYGDNRIKQALKGVNK